METRIKTLYIYMHICRDKNERERRRAKGMSEIALVHKADAAIYIFLDGRSLEPEKKEHKGERKRGKL